MIKTIYDVNDLEPGEYLIFKGYEIIPPSPVYEFAERYCKEAGLNIGTHCRFVKVKDFNTTLIDCPGGEFEFGNLFVAGNFERSFREKAFETLGI